MTWCSGYHGPTIGVAFTEDFETFHQLEHAFLPFNRNGVLFPRRIRDRYAMLSRPSDGGHTPIGDVFYSESPDLVHLGRHRHVLAPVLLTWESTKVGAGPTPIETGEGWLVLYHGVLTSCNGFVYSLGAALLDLDEPWRVVARPGTSPSSARSRAPDPTRSCHEPPKGGSERRLASDPRIITTVDEHAARALHDRSIAPSRRQEGVPCARCGAPVARRESDPSLMLALVLLATAGTVVVAAVAAAVAWIVT